MSSKIPYGLRNGLPSLEDLPPDRKLSPFQNRARIWYDQRRYSSAAIQDGLFVERRIHLVSALVLPTTMPTTSAGLRSAISQAPQMVSQDFLILKPINSTGRTSPISLQVPLTAVPDLIKYLESLHL